MSLSAGSRDNVSVSSEATRSKRRAPSSNVWAWKAIFSKARTRARRASLLNSDKPSIFPRDRSIWSATASGYISVDLGKGRPDLRAG